MALLESYLKDEQFARLLAQDEFILEMTETLCEILEKENISRQELAHRLGKSKGFISQLLNGGRNLTLRTIADICHVLGYKLKIIAYRDSDKKSCLTGAHFWEKQYLQNHPKVQWQIGTPNFPDNYIAKLAV